MAQFHWDPETYLELMSEKVTTSSSSLGAVAGGTCASAEPTRVTPHCNSRARVRPDAALRRPARAPNPPE
jgi:hypothetical protein